MSRIKFLLAAVLCVSLLAFAGCGNDNTANDNAQDNTVTEDRQDMGNNSNDRTDNGDSLTEDMADGAKDVIDDVEDAIDGKDETKSKKDTEAGQ
ncbi:MAG: hypothetical protein Q4B18_02960 [Bacillota bacterium]|nr:hypothetical protein [Bacillota bacterium]